MHLVDLYFLPSNHLHRHFQTATVYKGSMFSIILGKNSRLVINWTSSLGKKDKCLVSGNPTDPTFMGPTLNFFETSEIFSSIFRVFFNDLSCFSHVKINHKKCLPTDP